MHTANKLQHATAARAHDARPHCCLMSPFQRTPANTHISFNALYCQKLESLNYMTAAIVLVYLYLLKCYCFLKPRKGVQEER